MKAILGAKIGMTQVWKEGKMVPVTVIQAGPCPVVERRSPERDGYQAVQLGWGEVSPKRVNKPRLGRFKKNGVEPVRHLVEVRGFSPQADRVTVDLFADGELVDVTATSKGRGTAGVLKRHNFAGGDASHGSKKFHRRPGSIGNRKTPGRVYKGKRMAGRMGAERVTTQNLKLLEVRKEDNLLLVVGSVPGPNGGLVLVRDAVKARGESE